MAVPLPYRLRVYLTLIAVIFCVGIAGLVLIEHLTLLDALYFLIVTISTVGYGDISPLTDDGKILVILIILTGIGCFVGLVANAVEYVIDQKERKLRLEKLNMIIGIFFSEVGTKLLKKFSSHDPVIDEIRASLMVSSKWSDADFARAKKVLGTHVCALDCRHVIPEDLHDFLMQHKSFLLSLLENPQLIEHDSFTPLLQALFHLTEELMARETLTGLPETDYAHLSGDVNRVYRHLMLEWLTYMQYLKANYPYLFSLAMRQNPFDKHASITVT